LGAAAAGSETFRFSRALPFTVKDSSTSVARRRRTKLEKLSRRPRVGWQALWTS
jgi:hypothetical protein